MAKYAEGAMKTAKDKRLTLVNLEINGRFSKDASATASGPIGPKMAKKVWELWADLCNPKTRLL